MDELGEFKAQKKLWVKCINQVLKDYPNIKIILDGKHGPNWYNNLEKIPKADGLYDNVSAASIISKAHCDNILIEMDKIYPNYNFAQHKGYATPEHIKKINIYGFCEIHRPNLYEKYKFGYQKKQEIPPQPPLERLQIILKNLFELFDMDYSLATEWELEFFKRIYKQIFYQSKPLSEKQYFCFYKSKLSIIEKATKKGYITES